MGSVEVTTWGHSAVRFERAGQRLVIDPGVLSDPAVMEGAHAVLITHEHADHVVPAALAAAQGASSDLQVWAPAGVVGQLVTAEAPIERVHRADVGDTFSAAGFTVQALGGDHAVVHPTLATPVNLAYLIEGMALHPGDSFTPPSEGTNIELLLLPVSAPWLKLAESVDYVRQVAPTVAVPIHDAVLSDHGRVLTDQILTNLAGSDYRRINSGDALTLSH